jgi:hypothetical protein
VLNHEIGDLAKGRRRLWLAAREGVVEVAEKPRTSETTTADGYAVAASLADHAEGVLGDPDVAVAEDWD